MKIAVHLLNNSKIQEEFTRPLLDWYAINGRKELPWKTPAAAYPVWISEIMLQQTQVKTVIPFFTRFIKRFPDIASLAQASEDEVLALWSGLGYYSRARNIYKTAQIITQTHSGIFPNEPSELIKLPGIGETTAAAITSLVFNKPSAILDGNVKRVLCRFFAIKGQPEQSAIKKKLWHLAQACMSKIHCADYTQAIMDLGAMCCTQKKPDCEHCPLNNHCKAYEEKSVNSYPYKKLPKKIPTKKQQFLLLYTADQSFYLEKRPDSGLWGGLWCMPCIEQQHCAKTFISDNYDLNIESQTPLLTIKHTFSHFHLYINAIALRVAVRAETKEKNPKGKWYKAHEIEQLGLAKPVRDILYEFIRAY